MLCGDDNILWTIPIYSIHSIFKCGQYPRIFHGILSVPHNIVMNLNDVMKVDAINIFS